MPEELSCGKIFPILCLEDIEEIKKELEIEKIEYETIKWRKEALIIKNADEKAIQEIDI